MEGAIIKGVLIGFSIAAPVGPIGVLCIRRSIHEGKLSGFCTGLGAATADALYGLVAALGLTTVTGFLMAKELALSVIAGIFLLFVSYRMFMAETVFEDKEEPHVRLGIAYFSSFLLTLSNPMTIISFVAIFAGLGIGIQASSMREAFVFVAGVFLGSCLWWLILSSGASKLRTKLSSKWLGYVNKICGIILGVFGVIALTQSFWR